MLRVNGNDLGLPGLRVGQTGVSGGIGNGLVGYYWSARPGSILRLDWPGFGCSLRGAALWTHGESGLAGQMPQLGTARVGWISTTWLDVGYPLPPAIRSVIGPRINHKVIAAVSSVAATSLRSFWVICVAMSLAAAVSGRGFWRFATATITGLALHASLRRLARMVSVSAGVVAGQSKMVARQLGVTVAAGAVKLSLVVKRISMAVVGGAIGRRAIALSRLSVVSGGGSIGRVIGVIRVSLTAHNLTLSRLVRLSKACQLSIQAVSARLISLGRMGMAVVGGAIGRRLNKAAAVVLVSHSVGIARQVAMIRAVAQAVAPAAIRRVLLVVIATASTNAVAAWMRIVNKALSAVVSIQATALRRVTKIATALAVVSPFMSRLVSLGRMGMAVVGGAIGRRLNKAAAVVLVSHSVGIARQVAMIRAVALSMGGALSRRVRLLRSCNPVAVAGVGRSVSRLVTGVATSIAWRFRALPAMSFLAAVSATGARSVSVRLRRMASVAATAGTLARHIFKGVTAQAVAAATIARAVRLNIIAVTISTATRIRAVRLAASVASAAVDAVAVRVVAMARSVAVSVVSSRIRQVAVLFAAASTFAGNMIRGVMREAQASCSVGGVARRLLFHARIAQILIIVSAKRRFAVARAATVAISARALTVGRTTIKAVNLSIKGAFTRISMAAARTRSSGKRGA